MLKKSVCHPVIKFRTEVYLRISEQLIHQSIKNYKAPLQDPYSKPSQTRPSGKESSKSGATEHRCRLGGASDLKEARSRLLDQQLKRNCSALSQRGQMRPSN